MAPPHPSGEPGPLIGRGRAADVFDIGDGRVLRRNRNGASTDLEARVMRHLASHGYPVPEIHDAEGGDLVMQRLDGPTMLEAFPRQPWKVRSRARLLADLHQRLMRVPRPDFDVPCRFGSPEVLVHGDLHPDNVMLTDDGPFVIDWPNVTVGPPGADVASTWIIVATSEIDGSWLIRTVQDGVRASFLRQFLDRAGRDRARPWLEEVARHRLLDRNLRPGEAVNIDQLLVDEGIT